MMRWITNSAKLISRLTILSLLCASVLVQTGMADENVDEQNIDDVGVSIIDSTKRIIGGGESARDQFPYMAALVRYNSNFLTKRLFCGASVINEQWLLTAAHCMYGPFGNRISTASFRAVVDVINLRTESPIEYKVANYYLHPLYIYDTPRELHDIALIQLESNVPVAPISIYNDDASDLASFNAVIMGWGTTVYTDESTNDYPNELRHAELPIVSRDDCNAPVSHGGVIADTQVCAGFLLGGVDSCSGDSGGPLVTTIDGEATQVGIVSRGIGCAQPFLYGVYTNVGSYADWISQYTQINSVDRPITLASSSNGGSAGQKKPRVGAAWVLLWIMAGVISLRRRQ